MMNWRIFALLSVVAVLGMSGCGKKAKRNVRRNDHQSLQRKDHRANKSKKKNARRANRRNERREERSLYAK
jgi:hypothetical protein